MCETTPGTSSDVSAESTRMALFVFIIVTFAVFILPPLSAFFPSYPDILRPESIFLLLFLAVRLLCSQKLVKLSLEFLFFGAICFMTASMAWAASGLGIRILPQDFADIYSFLLYWAVFRYSYELTCRYQFNFIKTVTIIFFIIVVVQFAVVLGQRMNISNIINMSSWWSHDYDGSPWLRVTRPHGMTANAITLSILMVLYVSYFIGQVLSKTYFKNGIHLSLTGVVLSFFIIILSKSRTGFALLLLPPFIFAVTARESFHRILFTSVKIIVVMTITTGILFSAISFSGYRGNFVLVTAARELVSRIGNFVREGVHEKEGSVGRIRDAQLAFSQLKESPYMGIGPAQSLGKSWFHSSYITLLRRYGIIGLFAYLAPYFFVLLQFGRYTRCAGVETPFPFVGICLALTILAGGITNYTFIGEWQMNYFFWLVTGIIIARQHMRSETKYRCN